MPLFEYRCGRCAKEFEILIREETVPACPDCGGKTLEKLLSAFAVSTKAGDTALPPVAAGCGTCGDPRGPGACGLS